MKGRPRKCDGEVDWGFGYTRLPNEAFLRDGIAALFRPELRFPALEILWRCAHQREAGEVYSKKLGRTVRLDAGECLFGRDAFAKQHGITRNAARHLALRLVALGWISVRSTESSIPKVSPGGPPGARPVRAGCPSVLRLVMWREILLTRAESARCAPESRPVRRPEVIRDQQPIMGGALESEASAQASPDQLALWPCAVEPQAKPVVTSIDWQRRDFAGDKGRRG